MGKKKNLGPIQPVDPVDAPRKADPGSLGVVEQQKAAGPVLTPVIRIGIVNPREVVVQAPTQPTETLGAITKVVVEANPPPPSAGVGVVETTGTVFSVAQPPPEKIGAVARVVVSAPPVPPEAGVGPVVLKTPVYGVLPVNNRPNVGRVSDNSVTPQAVRENAPEEPEKEELIVPIREISPLEGPEQK